MLFTFDFSEPLTRRCTLLSSQGPLLAAFPTMTCLQRAFVFSTASPESLEPNTAFWGTLVSPTQPPSFSEEETEARVQVTRQPDRGRGRTQPSFFGSNLKFSGENTEVVIQQSGNVRYLLLSKTPFTTPMYNYKILKANSPPITLIRKRSNSKASLISYIL